MSTTPDRIGIGPGPFQTDFEVEYNTRTGSNHTRVYTGSLFECQTKRQFFIFGGASQVSLRPKGTGEWILTAYFPFDENGIESGPVPSIYELEVNIAQPSVYQNQKLRSLLADAYIGIVATVVRDYEAGQYSVTGGAAQTTRAEADLAKRLIAAGASTTEKSWGVKLFRTVAYRKTDSFIEYYQVFKRTLTAATPAQLQASYLGVGKIWTTNEMITQEGFPIAGGFFALDFTMQWLKAKPHVEAVANQKTQVQYYYTEFKQASYLLYDSYGAAILLDGP